MDPNATLILISNAIRIGDMEAAQNHAADLVRWIDRGGFEPNWNKTPSRLLEVAMLDWLRRTASSDRLSLLVEKEREESLTARELYDRETRG